MSELNTWAPSPEQLKLGDREVHVWRAYLDCDETVLRRLQTTLRSNEKARANRFLFRRDRDMCVATRGILRELLGKYVSRSPADLEFNYSPRGKPSLCAEFSVPAVEFNVSHSNGLALLAFAVGRSLGVDVEFVQPEIATNEMAERFFSPQEVVELRSLSPELRAEGFFLCWTRKEAYIKARGEGLHIPLESFHVSLTPGQAARLESADSCRWTTQSLCPDPRYAGALVGEGRDWVLRCWDWKPGECG